VQYQPNYNDCGVFAITFATSLLFNIKLNKVKYEHKLMRSHLIKVFETNVIEHFPQYLQYGVTQKVLPLAVINAREVEAIRIRMIRQHETEQQKLNRLGKCLNIYHSKKELYKIQSTLQSTRKKIQLSQNVSKKINNKIQTEQNNDNKCSQKKDRYLYSENLQYIQKPYSIYKTFQTKLYKYQAIILELNKTMKINILKIKINIQKIYYILRKVLQTKLWKY